MVTCSIEEKERLITRYTNVFKSSGLSLEESKKLANERFNSILGSGASTTKIDTTGITPEVITKESIQTVFDNYSNTNSIDSKEHLNTLQKALDTTMEVLSTKEAHNLFQAVNQGITRGEIDGTNISINLEEQAVNTPIPMSANEVLVHELLHAIFSNALQDKANYGTVKEIEKLWKQTKDYLTKKYGKGKEFEIFLNRDTNGNIVYLLDQAKEEEAAKKRYDYIFGSSSTAIQTITDKQGNKTTKEVSVNLHEFMSFGLSNNALIKAMEDFTVREETRPSTTWQDKIYNLYRSVLDWLVGTIYKTKGKTGNKALQQLALNLNSIHKRNSYISEDLMNKLDTIEEKGKTLIDNAVLKSLADWSWDKERKGKSTPFSALIGYINPKSHEKFKRYLRSLRRNRLIGTRTLIGELAKEATFGEENWVSDLIYKSKRLIERDTETEKVTLANKIKSAYTSPLTVEESKAITIGLLKTDVASILPSMGIENIGNLYEDSTYLEQQITDTKALLNNRNRTALVNQARSKGHHMATGEFLIHGTMPNALAMLKHTTSLESEYTDEANLDKLITLYAIRYTSADTKKLTSKIIKREQKNSLNDNGISVTLDIHNEYKKEALENNFGNQPMRMNKGYIENIYDPHISLKMVTKADIPLLKKQGYSLVKNSPVPKSIYDTDKTDYYLMINRYSGLDSRVKTAFSFIRDEHHGITMLNRASFSEGLDINKYQELLQQVASYNSSTRSNTGNAKDTGAIYEPIINEEGTIVNYALPMPFTDTQMLLNQELRVDQVIGSMYSRSMAKVNTKTINKEILTELSRDYREQYKKNKRDFVKINSESKDPELKEIYRLLPEDVKKQLSEYFGEKSIIIRNDLVRPIFAYRDKSLFNNAYINHWTFKVAEAIWKELIGVAKSSIVVRTVRVLRDNIISNTVALVWSGVPIEDAIRLQIKGIRNIHQYLQDEKEIRSLQLDLTKSTLEDYERSEIKARISTLKNSIKLNPIYPLIEKNMFSTISEDLDTTTSDYTYMNRFYNYFKPQRANKAWEYTEDAVSLAYMGKDTTAFQLMLKATQYSDFVMRYALYEHRMKKIEGSNLSKGDKERSIQELFTEMGNIAIKYEEPTSPWIKYGNDIGLLLFTRYPLRISKALFHLTRNRPSTTLLAALLGYTLGLDVPDPSDTNILNIGLNNPLSVAGNAFEFNGLGHLIN